MYNALLLSNAILLTVVFQELLTEFHHCLESSYCFEKVSIEGCYFTSNSSYSSVTQSFVKLTTNIYCQFEGAIF